MAIASRRNGDRRQAGGGRPPERGGPRRGAPPVHTNIARPPSSAQESGRVRGPSCFSRTRTSRPAAAGPPGFHGARCVNREPAGAPRRKPSLAPLRRRDSCRVLRRRRPICAPPLFAAAPSLGRRSVASGFLAACSRAPGQAIQETVTPVASSRRRCCAPGPARPAELVERISQKSRSIFAFSLVF